jgi:adenylyl cyclase-associated protein
VPLAQYNAASAAQSAAKSSAGGVEALFAEINQGDIVTKGLRKVDKSEMTHKNPALKQKAVMPASPVTVPGMPTSS